jgi:hypothetical protein
MKNIRPNPLFTTAQIFLFYERLFNFGKIHIAPSPNMLPPGVDGGPPVFSGLVPREGHPPPQPPLNFTRSCLFGSQKMSDKKVVNSLTPVSGSAGKAVSV